MSVVHAVDKGTEFGPYRVLSRLASGGMADVWLAETSVFGSSMRLVLKTMRPELAASRELAGMFVEEGLVAAKLQHENVVKVLDVGAIDGRTYIAMEFVRGRTLRQIGQRYHDEHRKVDVWFLVRVLLGACAALEYVHDFVDDEGWPLGLVHGDVSPENLMVSFNGAVKLVDFGISRASRPAKASSGALVVGKSWYMAPEQIRPGKVDHRSDSYSIGVILYEYLTGYRPFTGADEAEVLARVLEGKPAPLQDIASGVPEVLATLTMRAMSRDPEERFPSTAALAEELSSRLLEIDATAFDRPIDAHMARLFGEPDATTSSVRLTPKERPTRRSDLPTAPSDPSVVAEALARVEAAALAPRPPRPPRVPPPLPSARALAPTSPSEPPAAVSRATRPAITEVPRSTEAPHSSEVPRASEAPRPTAPAPHVSSHPAPPENRSGAFAAYREKPAPDIFGRAPKHEPPAVFGRPMTDTAAHRAFSTKALTDDEKMAARLFEQGLACVATKDFEGAQSAWRRAIELHPGERRYRANLKRLEDRLRDGG